MSKKIDTDEPIVPRHIGFILDGNRRWAKARGLTSLEGHYQGYRNIKSILDTVFVRGVSYVSLYVFSTENWSRTRSEVKYLLDLVLKIVETDLEIFHKKNIKMVWLGSDAQVSQKLQKAIRRAEAYTQDNTGGVLGLCFNHGGQREIVEAVQRIVASGATADQVNEELIADNLDYHEMPELDLVIRTSGEKRLSGFMLWRASYSEIIFRDEYWPDFSEQTLDECLLEYKGRKRRFGA